MALLPPNLDDRSFEDIFDQARALIPLYAPDWTDYNESDPGIALLQLYAWMTEMTLYRLNQVPERNYLKFLQLLGIQPKPAACAQVQLTFTVDSAAMAQSSAKTVIIPKGTRVASSAPATDATGATLPPPIFETNRALIAIEAVLAQVLSFDGAGFTILTNPNTLGQPYYPFGRNVRRGSALLLGFDSQLPSDQSFPETDIDLLVNIYSDSTRPQPSNACDPELAFSQPPVTLAWEFYDSQRWRPLSLVADETLALTRSGRITFTGPGDRVRKTTFPGAPAAPLYWVRARLVEGVYQVPPRLEKVLTNSVEATQALTVTEETLGYSNGSPKQTFTLDNRPVIGREKRDIDGSTIVVSALELVVDEGENTPDNGPRQGNRTPPAGGGAGAARAAAAGTGASREVVWEEVPDFSRSTRDSRHYLLNRTTGVITFGDGERGRIPPVNTQNAALNLGGNIIARRYEYGGGASGNLPAGQINELQSNVPFVESVTNPRPSLGGAPEESLSDAKLRAKQVVQNRGRAVTVDDFEKMAVETPGANIRRAHALPLTHPRFPSVKVPGAVTVVVIPNSEDQRPVPTEDTINRVCAYLSKNRLLTTEIYVTPPNYRKVTIEAVVIAKPEADLGEVQSDVEQRLETYFHPFKGGDGGSGWGFGQDIVYSDIYRQILNNAQVDRIEGKLTVYLDDVKQPEYQDVKIADNDLLFTEGHKIDVKYRGRS